jgi:hypothetical protein
MICFSSFLTFTLAFAPLLSGVFGLHGQDDILLISKGPGPNNSLGQCEGDCDQDSDCLPGLKCFERDYSIDKVPGCLIGGDGNFPTYDYCYDPDIPLVFKEPDPNYPLKRCEGDCDDDYDCGSGLKCFQREITGAKVPGCKMGGPGDQFAYDYCYDPNTEYPLVSRGPGPNKLLGRCEGDCDFDSDCDEGLKCFERDSSDEKVPGCLIGGDGDFPRYDYCSCWVDGTTPSRSWDDCCNPVEWWPAQATWRCGSEPCWGKDTWCGWGTCSNCCGGDANSGNCFLSVCECLYDW